MAHAEHEHPNPNPVDDPHTSPLVLGAILGVLLVIVTVYAVTALYFRSEQREVQTHVYDHPSISVTSLHGTQNADMTRYRWTDPANNLVGIPLEEAIDLTAKELAAKQK